MINDMEKTKKPQLKKAKVATKAKLKPVPPLERKVDVQKLEPQYARLVDTRGFVAAFWEFGCEYPKQEDAYEAVERQYKFIFGKRKYKNFESFRGCMYNYLNSVKCKK